MKITPHPTGIGRVALQDSLVIIDAFHREHLGLDFVEDSCEVTDDWTTTLKAVHKSSLALVDTRPEAFEAYLDNVGTANGLGGKTAWCVFPKNHAHLVEWVVTRRSIQKLAVRDYVVDEQVIALEVGTPQVEDVDAATLFRGITLGMELAGQKITSHSDSSAEIEVREQLISVLESLELVAFKKPEEQSLLEGEGSAGKTDEKAKRYIAELEGRVVSLNRKLDALQRKYDALANSKLGKIILTRWDKNRETGTGEDR